MAADAVQVAPHVYEVLFENERVRVLQVRLKTGESSAMHSHPAYVIYALGDGKVKFNSPSGESADIEVKTGEVMWREPEEHAVDNLGSTDVEALLFELK
jgi:quercetin dioxygenase-like cupin family protein